MGRYREWARLVVDETMQEGHDHVGSEDVDAMTRREDPAIQPPRRGMAPIAKKRAPERMTGDERNE